MTSRTGKTTTLGWRPEFRCDRSGSPKQQAGFTLLELLFVVTLVGLLYGVAVPRLRGSFEAARLEAAGETVKRSVNVARSGARASGETLALVWDPVAYEIKVLPLETAGSQVDPQPLIDFPAQDLPREFLIRWSDYRVTIYPDGSAEPAWIEIANPRGKSLRLEIEEYGTKVSKKSQ